MIVAQLVERSLPTLEIRGSNRQNLYIKHLFTVNCIEIKKKDRED